MTITVRIPTPLRTLTGGSDEVAADGATVREVIDDLEAKHPGIKDRLLDEKGVRRFVNIFANDEDIRFLDNLDTALRDGDAVQIIPAIAGGKGPEGHGVSASRSATGSSRGSGRRGDASIVEEARAAVGPRPAREAPRHFLPGPK